jgi:transposase
MSRPRKYPEELLERGVWLALESGRPIAHVARDLGIHSETLRKRVRQAEADQGLRPELPTSEEREEIKRLRQENFELRRANEILKSASVFFAKELDPDRPKRAATSMSTVAASGSSRSARRWACLCPPTTSGAGIAARRGLLRMSGCSDGSVSCTRPTTTPTATGERVEDEVGAHVAGELPADDHPRVGIEHEREEDESSQQRK